MNKRLVLLRTTKILLGLLVFALFLVRGDGTGEIRPAGIHSSYRFTLSPTSLNKPVWLRQDNLTIVLIRRSEAVIDALKNQADNLQDPNSDTSRQPDYAKNRLRSGNEQYFVAYGLGTDLGCSLIRGAENTLRESCGTAQYDFAGRAIIGQTRFQNLTIPDYNFNPDFSVLTVSP